MYRSTAARRTSTPHNLDRFPLLAIVPLFLILVLALVGAVASAAEADRATPNVAAVRAATHPVDTGNRSEDDQPGYTRALAAAGWDFNPSCAGGGRFDWFPIGHPCHTGHVVYPSGATVPAS